MALTIEIIMNELVEICCISKRQPRERKAGRAFAESASASREGASSIAAHVRRRGRGRGRRLGAGDGGVAPGAMRLPARPRQPVGHGLGLGLGLGLPPRARTGALLGAGGEWCSAATDWVRSYCLSTGQHGYRYLAENGLRLTERGLWLAVIVASTAMSAYIIGIRWSLYEGNPTLTVIEDSHYNTWNFPFPAVTICGINQLDRDKSAEFVQKLTVLNGMSREEIFGDLRLLPTFLDLDADEDLDHNYTRLQKVLDANNITVKQVMKEISPNCEDMVYRCMWKGRELLSCEKTFKDLKTFEGYCCTFNYVAYPEAELKRLNIDTTPKRVSACGKTTGLSIILRNQLDQYFDTFLASYGFKVMIHSELNYPDENAMEVLVPPGAQTFVGVSPTETYATNEVRNIPVERRHCRFEDEGRVEGMRKYTFNNCVMECRKNLSLQLCGCYAFFYPGAEATKICNMTQLLCLSRNRKRLAALVEMDFPMETSDFRVLPSPCGCLPECVMTRYRIQTTSIPFQPHLRKDLETKFYSNLDSHNHTVLHVFFTDVVGTRYRTSPFLGWLDLLASVGGILSLMLGFSMVCGFEVVYYFTLRVVGELLVRAKRRRAVGGPDRSADDFYGRGAGGGMSYASAVADVVGNEGVAPASVAPLAAAPLQPVIARDAHWRTVYPPAIDTGIARDFLRPPAGHEPRADVGDHGPGGPLAQQSLPMRRRRF